MNTDDKEKDTPPMLETILDAINGVSEHVGNLESKFDQLENKANQVAVRIERRFEDMRLQLMSFDVRIDRIESMGYEALSVAYSVRADVKVLREEVNAWMKDVQFPQRAMQDVT
jgi:hypothetical protein